MTIRSLFHAALAAAAFSTATALPASAQEMKVGIVDMKRVFQEYFKAKDAEKKVNEDKSKAKQDERSAKYRDLITKKNEIEKVLKDKLANEELKAQKQKEAQEIISEARALEREMEEFRCESQLQEQVVLMHKGLLDTMKSRVEEKAKLHPTIPAAVPK